MIRADLPKLCDAGYVIDHFECAGAGHVQAATDSIPYVLDWVDAAVPPGTAPLGPLRQPWSSAGSATVSDGSGR